jgi:predicted O-linked N-acetylglucosamine transferase (SPINDLY family)
MSPDDLLRRALDHHQSGRPAPARADYDELLRIAPRHADGWHLSGVLAWQSGDAAEGRRRVERALQLAPRQGLFWNSLGAILRDISTAANDEAGVVTQNEARRAFERAVECDPALAGAWSNLAAARSEAGSLEEAVVAANRALELNPELADARVNLGNALRALGRITDAEREFTAAVRSAPDSPLARNNLGSLLSDEGRTDEALPHFEAALRADPHYAPAWINLGQASQTRGDWEAASRFYARAAELRDSDGLRFRAALCLPVIAKSTPEITRARDVYVARLGELEGRALRIADPPRDVGTTSFSLAYQGFNDRELQHRLATLERRATPDLGFVAPHCREGASVSGSRPLRVGFVSRHWHDHSNARLMIGLVRAWPRFEVSGSGEWEVVLCRFADRDDPWSRFAASISDRELVLANPWRVARDQLASERFDVLVYTDLGMEPITRALAHARLARCQMTTWGVPVTTGLESLDAFVTSRLIEAPATEESHAGLGRSPHYIEPILELSLLPAVYVPPYQVRQEGSAKDGRLFVEDSPRDPPEVRRLVAARRKSARASLGASDADRLYVCPQSLFKLHPDFDGAIDDILRRDPTGMVLFVAGGESRWTELFRDRLGQRLGPRGSRVHILPRMSADAFQDLLAAADLLLDPWRFGGGNTTFEGLSWGTPVLTAPGEFLRGRVTLGCYRQMGCVPETSNAPTVGDEWPCVVTDENAYAERAVQFARNPEHIEHVRERILEQAPRLFHRSEAAREWSRGARRIADGS